MRLLTCLTLCLLLPTPALAEQNPSPGPPAIIDYETARLSRIATAVRITELITVDGVLNEPAWDAAPVVGDFTQQQPNTGAAAEYRTEVRFLYDDDNLYVGVVAFDPEPESATVNDVTEDFDFRSSDIFGLILDSLDDQRSGYLFDINPGGGRIDAQITNGSQFNQDWDGVWDVKTSRNGDAWLAEYRIPFRTLRFSNSPSQEWGLNMQRLVRRANESSFWSPLPTREQIMRVSMAGRLEGLEGIRQGRNLKIKPFAVAGFSQTRLDEDPFGKWTTEPDYDGGVDVKYGLTQSLTLDATYRTDFAQVEVDEQQVNLTRFNLFFPEKREFFLENAGTFNFGSAGGGSGFGGGENVIPFFSRRIGLSRQGRPIPIVGGARVTGQVGAYDVGFLTMKTESTDTTPSNTYTVGRVKQNLLENSWIGGLVTNRDSTLKGDYSRVYGADAHFRLFNRLDLDAYIMGSDTPGLDGKSQARKFAAEWRDEELVIEGGYRTVQANFNPEVGFVRRPNVTQYTGAFSWNPIIQSSNAIRNLIFATELEYWESGTTEQIETRTQTLNLGIRFQNQASINFSIDENFERLNERFQIRRDIAISEGDYGYRRYQVRASTDPTEKIAGGGNIQWGDFWDGARKSFSADLTVRPNYRVNVRFDYSRNQVDLVNGSFKTDLLGMRFVYAFTPQAFFNAFIQYNSDRNEVSSNVRLNVIHRPLSDLFIVYNDRRSADNGRTLDRALIVKFTNLFDF